MAASADSAVKKKAYYSDRIDLLERLFSRRGIHVEHDRLWLSASESYPIVDNVIVLLPPEKCPERVRRQLSASESTSSRRDTEFSEDIQFTFGAEWKTFSGIEPEYEAEFRSYFDIVHLDGLRGKSVLDLGCGMGRWSYFLRDYCGDMVLVDFSESIFIAHDLLKSHDRAIFMLGDICDLPLASDCADFAMCIGVLHCVPKNALEVIRSFHRLAPRLLVYVSYSLDNRPFYFRILLAIVTGMRRVLCLVRNSTVRTCFTWLAVFLIYLPCIWLGRLLAFFDLGRYVPLYETHNALSLVGLRQHVYDRFFSRIEQRFSRDEIMTLCDTYAKVMVSEKPSYWHFLCER